MYVLLDGVNNWIGGEGKGEQERDEEPAQIAKKGQFLLWNWQNVGKGRAEYETEYKILWWKYKMVFSWFAFQPQFISALFKC